VVARDETEKGERALLNFGHTVGHALESHGRYTSHLHGEAVAMGMVAELELARARGWVGPEVVATCREVLGRFGLSTDATRSERSGAVPFLEVDKKRKGGKVVLPFASEIGRGRLESVSTAELGVFLRGAG
jgi:3-dehydroquinate synthetase